MVEKGIRGEICHAIYRYMKANNEYMKDYEKKSSYLKYWDVSNLHGNEKFIKSYNGESDEGYSLEVDVQYPDKLNNLHNNLPFFLEKIKIEKVEKF